jgi:hypothetical protein
MGSSWIVCLFLSCSQQTDGQMCSAITCTQSHTRSFIQTHLLTHTLSLLYTQTLTHTHKHTHTHTCQCDLCRSLRLPLPRIERYIQSLPIRYQARIHVPRKSPHNGHCEGSLCGEEMKCVRRCIVKAKIWDGNGTTEIEKRAKVSEHLFAYFQLYIYDKLMGCKIVFHTRTQRART